MLRCFSSPRDWDRRYFPGFPAGARWEQGRHTPRAKGTEHLNSSAPSLLSHCSKHQSLQTRRHREIKSSKITGALPGCWSVIPAGLPALPAPPPSLKGDARGCTAHSHPCFQTAAASSRLGNPSRIRSTGSLISTLSARNHWDPLSWSMHCPWQCSRPSWTGLRALDEL